MDKHKAQQEVQRLSEEIEQHNYNYYVLDNPTISDEEYDGLLKALMALEEWFPEFRLASSPTARVGAKVASGTKAVTHAVRMISLDNTYSQDELRDWFARVFKGLGTRDVLFSVEPKIDGVSASLLYEAGSFVLGATRGDGEKGEDVTHNIRAMRSIPMLLRGEKAAGLSLLEVRGEVYMDKADFLRVNEDRKAKGDEVFANPRNAASGSLKLLDPAESAQRRLRFFAHSFGRISATASIDGQAEFLALAKDLGFSVNPFNRVCRSPEEVLTVCGEMEGRRAGLPYDVDGVVVKVASFSQQEMLGETMKSPRWAVAFKFQAYQATTIVKDIVVQVGRTGVLTPVAELEPVACGGVTISRATLHNFDEIDRLGVCKGDRVLLERAGDVIPKIVKVTVPATQREPVRRLPTNCGACREDFIHEDPEVVAYRCINPACPRQLERRLLHFASRGAMDIEGMGDAVVASLIEKGLVRTVADIYTLTQEQLLGLPLFAQKKAEKLCASIAISKARPLSRLIFGLGILNIGEKASLLLARRFQTMAALSGASRDEVLSVHEIGEVSADALLHFFRQEATRDVLQRLLEAGVNMTEPQADGSGRLSGKIFVFTGELERQSRSDAGALVKALGGEVGAAVTKRTDFVVAGSAAGSKLDKARTFGVKVINEQQFEEMVHDG